MLRRFVLFAIASIVPALLVAVPQPGAFADPIPVNTDLPWCLNAPGPKTYLTGVTDDDNRYCVWSIQKDETGTGSSFEDLQPIPYGEPGHAGLWEDVWVYSWDASTAVAWAMNTRQLDASGTEIADPVNETNPDWLWRIQVNIGAMQPRQLNGVTKENDYSLAPSSFGGQRLTVTFKPAPIAWRWDFSGGENPVCVPGDCGDDSTVAELVSDGFFNGYVTDLDGFPASEREHRTGMITAWNANYATEPQYNADVNALEVQLANPHLSAPGVPATGHYEAFLPNAYLVNVLQVPDPSTLTAGSFVVSRASGSTVYPATVSHEAGGVRINVTGLTYSSYKLRIKPKASVPGMPRWGSVSRATPTKAKVSFRRPVADGGPNITTYQARCRRGDAAYKYAKGSASPLYVADLPRREVTCQVRAKNKVGWGQWGKTKTG